MHESRYERPISCSVSLILVVFLETECEMDCDYLEPIPHIKKDFSTA